MAGDPVGALLNVLQSGGTVFDRPLQPGFAQVPSQQIGSVLDALAPVTGAGSPALSPGGVPPSQGGTGTGTPAAGSSGGNAFMEQLMTTLKGPPAWLAKAALAAYQSGNTKYFNHLLSDPAIAGNPHLKNFVTGLMQGDPSRITEANYYATNPSYNGWNNAMGDGIPNDGK